MRASMLLGLFAAATAVGAPASAIAGPEGLTNDRNARDMTLATAWFAGEFDNDLQVWFETDPRSDTPTEARHSRIHTVHTRLSDSILGSPAFLVREYADDDRSKPPIAYVARLSSLKPAEGIQLRYYRLAGDPMAPAAITARMLKPLPGCDLTLRQRGAQLEGETNSGACAMTAGKAEARFREKIWLGRETYTRQRWPVSPRATRDGARDESPIAFYKARPFTCAVNMFADSYLKPSSTDKAYTFENRHDLGDLMTVESPRDGKRYHVQLRRQRYPYYQNGGEFLLLRLREIGAPTSAALVTSDTMNNSISLNLGWAMINCNSRGL